MAASRERIYLFDTTLRDGAQTNGVDFTLADKIAISRMLDELGIADNTIVVFTTDNGAMAAWWPDGGTTPFRGEKATTWEGGVRVPMLVRWPAAIKPGS